MITTETILIYAIIVFLLMCIGIILTGIEFKKISGDEVKSEKT